MIELTLAEVADATGAVPRGGVALDSVVTRVVSDSRQAGPGDLFVAIAGERYDGHDHAAAAILAGAVAVLGARELTVPTLVVADPLAGLGQLAHAVLERLTVAGRPCVVGITGSVGKTGTKDLLAQVLSHLGPTVSARGSFNNEIGLPTTVLDSDRDTEYLVLELGARGIGHIRRLTQIAAPRIGVVLGVGTAHLGEFGSRAAIAQAKGELVEALPAAGGVAVLNADDPLVSAMATRTAARVRTFGRAPDADVRASEVALDGCARASFRLHIADGSVPVSLTVSGAHAVTHALAAATVADALGMALPDIAAALSTAVRRSPGRMAVLDTEDGITVLDDSYNASPESVRAALHSLVVLAGTGAAEARRSWAVLGEMRELGASSEHEHEQVGRLAVRLGVGGVVCVGAGASGVLRGAVEQAGASGGDAPQGTTRAFGVPTVGDAITMLRQQVHPGDVVLVKASRAIGLERVVAALTAADHQGASR